MVLTRQTIIHDGPGGTFESVAVVDDAAAGPVPGILLVPNVLGTKEADFLYAEKVAALGYAVLVADVFGQGKRTTREDPDAGRYMNELNADRVLLRDRMLGAHALLKNMPAVDAARTAAIGFCFGGKCVLDLAARAPTLPAASASTASMRHRPSPTPRSPPSCWSAMAGKTRSRRPRRPSAWRRN